MRIARESVPPSAFRPAYPAERAPRHDDLAFAFHADQLLVAGKNEQPRPVQMSDLHRDEWADAHYLGDLNGMGCWAVDVTGNGVDGYEPRGLRSIFGTLNEDAFAIAGMARQVIEWERTHRFCGRCGEPTLPHARIRARMCGSCSHMMYPRVTPAVIMLVYRDGEVLLARAAHFPGGIYSTLAGFVEPGETLEEAVVREVFEEVGVEVGGIRYFGSQSWPFPHSLMVGFTARWTGGAIRIDRDELEDAQWFAHDDLPRLSSPMSISRSLIDSHLESGSR